MGTARTAPGRMRAGAPAGEVSGGSADRSQSDPRHRSSGWGTAVVGGVACRERRADASSDHHWPPVEVGAEPPGAQPASGVGIAHREQPGSSGEREDSAEAEGKPVVVEAMWHFEQPPALGGRVRGPPDDRRDGLSAPRSESAHGLWRRGPERQVAAAEAVYGRGDGVGADGRALGLQGCRQGSLPTVCPAGLWKVWRCGLGVACSQHCVCAARFWRRQASVGAGS